MSIITLSRVVRTEYFNCAELNTSLVNLMARLIGVNDVHLFSVRLR